CHGRGQLEVLRLLLFAIVLPGLGPELRGGLPRTLRRPTRQSLRQLGQFVLLAVQSALVQQRLSPGTPLGPESSLDENAAHACADRGATGGQRQSDLAGAAHYRLDRGLPGPAGSERGTVVAKRSQQALGGVTAQSDLATEEATGL